MADRAFARKLIEEYVPEKGLPYIKDFLKSNPQHNEIINRFKLPDGSKSVYSEYAGVGTTCGYICHWLLFRLGLTDTALLNRTTFRTTIKPSRDDFDDFKTMGRPGFDYVLPGKRKKGSIEHGILIPARPENDNVHFETFFMPRLNLTKIAASPAFKKVDSTKFDVLKTMKYGDIGLMRGKNKILHSIDMDTDVDTVTERDTSHVFIITDPIGDMTDPNRITFKTVEGGQNLPNNINVIPKQRTFYIKGNVIKVEEYVGHENNRAMLGFLNLDEIEFLAPKPFFREKFLYNPALTGLYSPSSISTTPNTK
jgi:hypothetical protein